jgi:hypothetical protein
MELLTDIWDKTTDGLSAVSEKISDGLIRVFGNSNERQIRRMRPTVARVNELEPAMQALSDEDLRPRPPSSGRAWRRARRSTTCCRRPSPPAARRAAAS